MARQQRRVEVQRAVRQVEERPGHDLAVVGEDDQAGGQVEDRGDGIGPAQPLRREDRRQAQRLGGLGDR
jgi:hypothetical protein